MESSSADQMVETKVCVLEKMMDDSMVGPTESTLAAKMDIYLVVLSEGHLVASKA